MKKLGILTIASLLLATPLFGGNIEKTAKAIKKGSIKVGKVYGLEPGQRFHNIHNKVLGLDCSSCHVSSLAPDYPYQRKYKELPMGQVDRGICLGCHKANGPAVTKLYGTAEK